MEKLKVVVCWGQEEPFPLTIKGGKIIKKQVINTERRTDSFPKPQNKCSFTAWIVVAIVSA